MLNYFIQSVKIRTKEHMLILEGTVCFISTHHTHHVLAHILKGVILKEH